MKHLLKRDSILYVGKVCGITGLRIWIEVAKKKNDSFSELEKYKPWKDIEFSGKAEYELDDVTYSDIVINYYDWESIFRGSHK